MQLYFTWLGKKHISWQNIPFLLLITYEISNCEEQIIFFPGREVIVRAGEGNVSYLPTRLSFWEHIYYRVYQVAKTRGFIKISLSFLKGEIGHDLGAASELVGSWDCLLHSKPS